MKKVLILGANRATVTLVQKAKEMGLYTIVTDYNPNAYAKRYADQAENVDCMDIDALVALGRRENVDGVLVGVAEILLPIYCKVCNRLGLPCYSTLDVFEIMMRKDLFKQKCREYNVPTIREYDKNKADEIHFPVIIKPVDNCGSKGIRVCMTKEHFKSDIDFALSFSESKKCLVEEYMQGDEVVAYYVVQDGNPIFVAMCDRYTYKPSGDFVQLPTCYVYPSRHIDSFMRHTDPAVKDMLRGIGVKNCSLFLQCFVDSDGIVRIYEPGHRLTGCQEHMALSVVSGVDFKECFINFALTGKVSESDLEKVCNPRPDKFACKLSPLVKTGKIAHIGGLDEIARIPEVVAIAPSYDDGDTVSGEGTLAQIISRFFIVCDSIEGLGAVIDRIQSLLTVTDENGEEMMMATFDTSLLPQVYSHKDECIC